MVVRTEGKKTLMICGSEDAATSRHQDDVYIIERYERSAIRIIARKRPRDVAERIGRPNKVMRLSVGRWLCCSIIRRLQQQQLLP
jgi:hypothetical protein